jgi:hypothetical protein
VSATASSSGVPHAEHFPLTIAIARPPLMISTVPRKGDSRQGREVIGRDSGASSATDRPPGAPAPRSIPRRAETQRIEVRADSRASHRSSGESVVSGRRRPAPGVTNRGP